MFRKLSSLFLVLFLVSPSLAATISAYELIDDAQPFELFSRNLERTRSDSTGFFDFTSNAAQIVAENSVNSAFGIWNNSDVSYSHDLTWLNPAADSFLNATLTIQAYGVDGNDDKVFADSIFLGNLVSDGMLIFEGFTTTVFSSANPLVLNAILADGFLNIFVNKNSNAFIGNGLDKLSVFSSKLEVTYEPVPEPATALLLGGGLLAAIRRRKIA